MAQRHEPEGRRRVEFVRADPDPSERYALVLPGSIKSRMKPGDKPFSDLLSRGRLEPNACQRELLENAVQSGMMAAEAIGGVHMPIKG